MKKGIAAALVCLLAVSPALTAEAHHGNGNRVCGIGGCNLGECFMDADGDGICGDHSFLDENGDGICDNHCYYDGNGDSICDYFVDADEDGVCDHCHDHGKPVIIRTTRKSCGHHGSRHGCR